MGVEVGDGVAGLGPEVFEHLVPARQGGGAFPDIRCGLACGRGGRGVGGAEGGQALAPAVEQTSEAATGLQPGGIETRHMVTDPAQQGGASGRIAGAGLRRGALAKAGQGGADRFRKGRAGLGLVHQGITDHGDALRLGRRRAAAWRNRRSRNTHVTLRRPALWQDRLWIDYAAALRDCETV